MVDFDKFLSSHPTKYHRLPKGYREDHRTGQVACPHRDLSVCKLCDQKDFIVEVHGVHFFAPLGRAAHMEYLQISIAEAEAAEKKLATIARTRRPTAEESAEALRAYDTAAKATRVRGVS